jgi:hypothetical protein
MSCCSLAFFRFFVFGLLLTAFFGVPVRAPSAQGTAGDTALRPPSGLTVTPAAIKGDLTTLVYHRPGCPEYDRVDTATMVLFATEEEAQRAGFHKAENCS